MTSLANKGFQISKNVMFSVLTSKAAKLLGKPGKIGLLLHDAYQKLVDQKSSKSGFAQIKELMFSFIRLVRSYISGDYRDISTKTIVLGIATLLYVVSPIDLVPDFIPLIGFADDISLMAWFLKTFQQELSKFREWEQGVAVQAT